MATSRGRTAVALLLAAGLAVVTMGGRTSARGRGAIQPAGERWVIGTPIVTYWGGPDMSGPLASRLAAGGWNLVWCGEADLDTAARLGLRCQLRHPLLSPDAFAKGGAQALRDLVRRVRRHPALYTYFLVDEPSAAQFETLGRLVALLREEDPAHAAYINLLPTYATNAQLGTAGRPAEAYRSYVRRFVADVRPALLSFDHYNLMRESDRPDYFLNLAIVRQEAMAAGLPFLAIVQASAWDDKHRVPTPAELRYLVYTTLAYGAQGLSYYVLHYRQHRGGAIDDAGAPTTLFEPMTRLNREFARLAGEMRRHRQTGVYHVGSQPEGTSVLPLDAAIQARAAIGAAPAPRGLVVALLGSDSPAGATHAFIVNADHRSEVDVAVRGRAALEWFAPDDGRWVTGENAGSTFTLAPGDGRLVRLRERSSAAVREMR